MHGEPPEDPGVHAPVPTDPFGPGSEALLAGDSSEMLRELYDELRALAAHYLRGERADHTLQPTALLHEAYLRLHDRLAIGVTDRVHLMALISRTMRRVLVDHARMHTAAKRQGQRLRVTFSQDLRITDNGFEDLLDLHLVLERYRLVDERAARIAEWHLFGGFTHAQVAQRIGMSEKTVRNEFAVARAWLRRELTAEVPPPDAQAGPRPESV